MNFQVKPLAMIALLLLSVGCDEVVEQPPAPQTTPPAAVTVNTVILKPQILRGEVTTFGVVEGLEEVDIASETNGTVSRVLVNEGDAVEIGDLLLELDAAKLELRLAQATQAAREAKAALSEAKLRLERRIDLAEKDTISRETLDNARLAVSAVSASYQRALAVQNLAEAELRDTRILSPSKGLVDHRLVEPGEPVMLGATLITLQVVHVMRVHTWVSEADVTRIRANAEASIELTGLPGRSYDAIVEWVGVNADASTGNFPVKLILQSEEKSIRPGMTATVRIASLAQSESLLLPERALIDRDRKKVVFVMEDGIAHQREPLLGAGYTNQLQILAGLKEGDRVVIDNQHLLIDGTPVSTKGL